MALFILFVGLVVATPFEAHADGFVSGFFGRAFGGDTDLDFSEAIRNRETWTYGFNAGAMGGGAFGAEFDFGYTPKFFGSNGTVVDGSSVMTIMGSLIAGIPVGGQSGAGIRPYGVFGVGLIRRSIEFTGIFDDRYQQDHPRPHGLSLRAQAVLAQSCCDVGIVVKWARNDVANSLRASRDERRAERVPDPRVLGARLT